jgi:hypothetical protein
MLFGFGLIGARALRRTGHPMTKWSIVVASSIAILALLNVHQWQ